MAHVHIYATSNVLPRTVYLLVSYDSVARSVCSPQTHWVLSSDTLAQPLQMRVLLPKQDLVLAVSNHRSPLHALLKGIANWTLLNSPHVSFTDLCLEQFHTVTWLNRLSSLSTFL